MLIRSGASAVSALIGSTDPEPMENRASTDEWTAMPAGVVSLIDCRWPSSISSFERGLRQYTVSSVTEIEPDHVRDCSLEPK